MVEEYKFGKLFGLNFSIVPSFFVGTVLLWVVQTGAGYWFLKLPLSQAILGGLEATLLYWVANIIHHLAHAYAARRTGHPMVGVRLGTRFIFGTSVYPKDEEPLPANIHIRRAVGGPIGSLLFAIVTGIIAGLLFLTGGAVWWIALYLCLISFFIFTLGPFLPLGFTDGSTILEWRGKKLILERK